MRGRCVDGEPQRLVDGYGGDSNWHIVRGGDGSRDAYPSGPQAPEAEDTRADKGYDTRGFVSNLRRRQITPHVAANTDGETDTTGGGDVGESGSVAAVKSLQGSSPPHERMTASTTNSTNNAKTR